MATENESVPLSTGVSQPATSMGAVFLSYASEDAAAAERIADALRAAGIEVWFDREELRGGDAWDRRIREQIHDCRLFIPVISAHTEGRDEGYFRREWKLAVDRTHDMDEHKAFLVPVVIDVTSERGAHVPEKFRELQWTRLPAGATPSAFVERIQRLLAPQVSSASAATTPLSHGPTTVQTPSRPDLRSWQSRPVLWAIGVVLGAGLVYFVTERVWVSKRTTSATVAAPSSISAPDKSIAVLPFVDLSEKHDQEYFGDGMAEEILNLLVRIPELKVIGRTSSFAFKGRQADLPSIGRALGVAYIVEGSVRRSSERIRVTVQLVDARNGSHRWSNTFDGTPTDMIRFQDDIAVRVAHLLNLDIADPLLRRATVESPEAYEYYLRGIRELDTGTADGNDTARKYFQKALAIDPHFSPAAVGIATADQFNCVAGVHPEVSCPLALASVEIALKLDPRSPDAYSVRAEVRTIFSWDWAGATADISKAADLGGSRVSIFAAARLACAKGDTARARRLYQEILTTDPFDSNAMEDLGFFVELNSRNYEEAESWVRRGLQITPGFVGGLYSLGLAQLMQGKLDEALASMKQEKPEYGQAEGLALVYAAMGRKADSDAALNTMQRRNDYFPSDFARIYAFRRDLDRALRFLEAGYETHDPDLWYIKGDPLLKNLESDPRYKAFLRKMNLPE
jgi:TolB-like protein